METAKDVPKSECLPVMGRIEVLTSARKGAHVGQVFHSKEGRYTRESMSFNDAERREAY